MLDRQTAGASVKLEGQIVTSRRGRRLVVRRCSSFQELDACVALQAATWGYSDLETLPRRTFVLSQELGGQLFGAFDLGPSEGENPASAASADHRDAGHDAGNNAEESQLVGFAMAMPAFGTGIGLDTSLSAGTGEQPRRNRPYLHSHMLAVHPDYRDSGLGVRLKLVQREDALARGITRMTWTFDPLAAKNAYLNLERLGAVALRYTPDFYGPSDSQLQAGLPTDRLHAEWWMATERVRSRVDRVFGLSGAATFPPPATEASQNTLSTTIVLPQEVAEWKSRQQTLPRALALQAENRERFLHAFAHGLALTGFEKDAHGHGVFVLTPQNELESKDIL